VDTKGVSLCFDALLTPQHQGLLSPTFTAFVDRQLLHFLAESYAQRIAPRCEFLLSTLERYTSILDRVPHIIRFSRPQKVLNLTDLIKSQQII
jgi:hypothetical protein